MPCDTKHEAPPPRAINFIEARWSWQPHTFLRLCTMMSIILSYYVVCPRKLSFSFVFSNSVWKATNGTKPLESLANRHVPLTNKRGACNFKENKSQYTIMNQLRHSSAKRIDFDAAARIEGNDSQVCNRRFTKLQMLSNHRCSCLLIIDLLLLDGDNRFRAGSSNSCRVGNIDIHVRWSSNQHRQWQLWNCL